MYRDRQKRRKGKEGRILPKRPGTRLRVLGRREGNKEGKKETFTCLFVSLRASGLLLRRHHHRHMAGVMNKVVRLRVLTGKSRIPMVEGWAPSQHPLPGQVRSESDPSSIILLLSISDTRVSRLQTSRICLPRCNSDLLDFLCPFSPRTSANWDPFGGRPKGLVVGRWSLVGCGKSAGKEVEIVRASVSAFSLSVQPNPSTSDTPFLRTPYGVPGFP